MIIIAIDPGYRQSAIVTYRDGAILGHGIHPNESLLESIADHSEAPPLVWNSEAPVLVIEQMQLFASNYGVGQEIFDSVFWSGRFVQVWSPRRWDRILRSKVRGHLQASKGGDAAVRAALIHRFGPYKEQAVGTKKQKGPLYGIKADEWSALAIAVTYHDLNALKPSEVRPGVVAEW